MLLTKQDIPKYGCVLYHASIATNRMVWSRVFLGLQVGEGTQRAATLPAAPLIWCFP